MGSLFRVSQDANQDVIQVSFLSGAHSPQAHEAVGILQFLAVVGGSSLLARWP